MLCFDLNSGVGALRQKNPGSANDVINSTLESFYQKIKVTKNKLHVITSSIRVLAIIQGTYCLVSGQVQSEMINKVCLHFT